MLIQINKQMTSYDFTSVQTDATSPSSIALSPYMPSSGAKSGKLVIAVQSASFAGSNGIQIAILPAWKLSEETIAVGPSSSPIAGLSLNATTPGTTALILMSNDFNAIPAPGFVVMLYYTNTSRTTSCRVQLQIAVELLPT